MPDAAPPLRPLMVVPDFDRIGGYELQALSLAAHHVSTGVPSFVVTNNHHDLPAREVRHGVTIHRLPFLPPSRKNWAALFTAFLVFLRAHRREYDVIHCHALTFLAACCVRIGRLLGKPVVVKVATERDVREFHDDRSFHFRLFFRWLKTADRLLCLSERIRAEAIACGFRDEQAVIVRNGVDTRRFAPASPETRAAARTALGLRDGELALLYVGRLVQRKGVDVLLNALPLCGPAAQARVFVVGDGERAAEWRALAQDLGVAARVTFAGEQADVAPFLAAADAFVFPSRLEGLPNALLEAMACGLPAIATRIGGCVDVMTDDAGILVGSDDARALAAAMDRLAADAGERARLGEAARRRVQSAFSFDVTAERLQSIYREVARPVTARPSSTPASPR
ncbi:MAG: glycosyltransferase family 4 protein [Planctomycetes bacterium]|nr:glycosyltransferase family 4 protein [Planctomycetota bacterium]